MTISPAPDRAVEIRSLVSLLEKVLASVVAGYAAASVDLPERRYWTMQQPSADCEQLVVSFLQTYIGPPGDEASQPQRCNSPRSASLTVQVVRCIPTVSAKGRPPTAEQIQDGSEPLAVDAWLLLDIASDLEQWDPYGGPGLGVIATVDADEPQGGYQSVSLRLTMAIP